jgi:hypothetical protein
MTFHHYITLFIRVPISHEWLINWVLAPLSAVFQLYGDQLLVMEEAGVLESTTDHEQAIRYFRVKAVFKLEVRLVYRSNQTTGI